MGDVIQGMLRARAPGRHPPGMAGFTGRGGPSWEARARAMEAMGHDPEKAKLAAKAGIMLPEPAAPGPTVEEEAARAGAMTTARLKAAEPFEEAQRGREATKIKEERDQKLRERWQRTFAEARERHEEVGQKTRAGVDPDFMERPFAEALNLTWKKRNQEAADAEKRKEEEAEQRKREHEILTKETAKQMFAAQRGGEPQPGQMQTPPGQAADWLRSEKFAVPRARPSPEEEAAQAAQAGALTTARMEAAQPFKAPEAEKPSELEKAEATRLRKMESTAGVYKPRDLPDAAAMDFLRLPRDAQDRKIAEWQKLGMGDAALYFGKLLEANE